jgi:signal transduction histidine kinase
VIDARAAELERVAAEQAALRRVATLVAEGADETELAAAVTSEIGRLFGAQRAFTMRWAGDTLRAIGDWSVGSEQRLDAERVYPFGGDTVIARVVSSGAPVRLESPAELHTEFARRQWAEFGFQAALGAPIVVAGEIWGGVVAFRTHPDDPFPPGLEHRLEDFAALVAQAIFNAEARREAAQLVAEQSALRRIATLVAAGRPQVEVLDAVTSEIGPLFAATRVHVVRQDGEREELVVVAAWSDPSDTHREPGSPYDATPGGATLAVLDSGVPSCVDESSPDRGLISVISAPLILKAAIVGALTASRPGTGAFGPRAETRLRSFADLAAQAIANERAQAELRESRARIVRAADETRRRLERNLHDGAQQRLVSASLTLRLAVAQLWEAPRKDVHDLLVEAADELTQALAELRDLARGLHPAILSDRGLTPALKALAERAPLPVELTNEIDGRLPAEVEAALYYVVAESLTNVAKYAQASQVTVRASNEDGVARIEVADDGAGGAVVGAGSGLRGLADRIEALGGSFGVASPAGQGTRVWAEVLLDVDSDVGSSTGD